MIFSDIYFFVQHNLNLKILLKNKNIVTVMSGIGLSKNLLAYIATRYCGKDGGLSWDDFVLISIKTQTLHGK